MTRSQISELVFAYHACVSVYLALYLILKNASSFGQMTDDDEGFTTTGNLAHVRGKANLLSDGEFVCRHVQRASCSVND